jgi:hypothetical protein
LQQPRGLTFDKAKRSEERIKQFRISACFSGSAGLLSDESLCLLLVLFRCSRIRLVQCPFFQQRAKNIDNLRAEPPIEPFFLQASVPEVDRFRRCLAALGLLQQRL